MAGTTGIEWCDATFNPWWGCEKVSPACAHCYADTLSKRYAAGKQLWGDGHEFRFFGDKHWAEPLKWARLLPAKLGRRPRVFCASMADVFEARPELDEHRDRLFALIEQTPELDWLLLTKRPELAREWMFEFDSRATGPLITRDDPEISPWGCPPNIWLGVSIENARYTWRADVLREIPAAVRFISAEPLLGSLFEGEPCTCRSLGVFHAPDCRILSKPREQRRAPLDLTGIDWVIAGGESGPKARPSHPDWFREIRDACLSECDPYALDPDVPGKRPAFFFKQWGEWANGSNLDLTDRDRVITYDGKVRTWPDWREQGYAAGAGHARPVAMHRAGKRNAGRELDGRSWDEFPQSAAVPA